MMNSSSEYGEAAGPEPVAMVAEAETLAVGDTLAATKDSGLYGTALASTPTDAGDAGSAAGPAAPETGTLEPGAQDDFSEQTEGSTCDPLSDTRLIDANSTPQCRVPGIFQLQPCTPMTSEVVTSSNADIVMPDSSETVQLNDANSPYCEDDKSRDIDHLSAMKPPGGESHDLWGAEFKGTPCHHRVLKPPGGGCSDIFGASEPMQNSPRRVRSNLQSSVFGPPNTNGESAPRTKPGNDSYNRLFGPASSRPQSGTKNRLKSNIMLSADDSTSTTKDSNSNTPGKESCTTVDAPVSAKDGNPVTGEGYSEEKQPVVMTNGQPATNGTSHSAPPQRSRVPPGGFSSGLW